MVCSIPYNVRMFDNCLVSAEQSFVQVKAYVMCLTLTNYLLEKNYKEQKVVIRK